MLRLRRQRARWCMNRAPAAAAAAAAAARIRILRLPARHHHIHGARHRGFCVVSLHAAGQFKPRWKLERAQTRQQAHCNRHDTASLKYRCAALAVELEVLQLQAAAEGARHSACKAVAGEVELLQVAARACGAPAKSGNTQQKPAPLAGTGGEQCEQASAALAVVKRCWLSESGWQCGIDCAGAVTCSLTRRRQASLESSLLVRCRTA